MESRLAEDYEEYWMPIRKIEMQDSMPAGRDYSWNELRLLYEEIRTRIGCLQSWSDEWIELENLMYAIGLCKSPEEFFKGFKNLVIVHEKLRPHIGSSSIAYSVYHMLFGDYLSGFAMKDNPLSVIMRWRKWLRKI